jgi:RNA polymerase sigma-70 factor, ECF subfamily
MSFPRQRGPTVMSSPLPSSTATGADDEAVAAVRRGDQAAFDALVQAHRRELHVHCYRMLGSLADAEDLVQETFLRAWRRRETFAGRATVRAWLYRIATNACLDHLQRIPRQAVPRADGGPGEVSWLQPYPDRLLAPADDEPDAVVVARETIELAFLVAVQHLPPRQRAVLMLRDVLGWPAADTAELLEVSVASVNSMLQRARATLRDALPAERAEWAAPAGEPTEQERSVLRRFMEATERADMAALGVLLREDVLFTMPPQPDRYRGRDVVIESWTPVMTGPVAWGEFRCVAVPANRQPALANYLRRTGEAEFRALSLDVLRIENGLIAEITTFGPAVFGWFGLPDVLG